MTTMTRSQRLESTTISLFSKLVEKSQVSVRVRRIGNRDRIIVDLFVISPEGHEVLRPKLNKIAINAAIVNGAVNADFLVIHDYLTQRRSYKLDGTACNTNVREKSYVFHGVNA